MVFQATTGIFKYLFFRKKYSIQSVVLHLRDMAKNLLEFSSNTQACIPYSGFYIYPLARLHPQNSLAFSIVISIAFRVHEMALGFNESDTFCHISQVAMHKSPIGHPQKPWQTFSTGFHFPEEYPHNSDYSGRKKKIFSQQYPGRSCVPEGWLPFIALLLVMTKSHNHLLCPFTAYSL